MHGIRPGTKKKFVYGVGEMFFTVVSVSSYKYISRNDGKIFHGDAQDGYDWGRMNLKSVTEDASYIDFLNTAEAAR